MALKEWVVKAGVGLALFALAAYEGKQELNRADRCIAEARRVLVTEQLIPEENWNQLMVCIDDSHQRASFAQATAAVGLIYGTYQGVRGAIGLARGGRRVIEEAKKKGRPNRGEIG